LPASRRVQSLQKRREIYNYRVGGLQGDRTGVTPRRQGTLRFDAAQLKVENAAPANGYRSARAQSPFDITPEQRRRRAVRPASSRLGPRSHATVTRAAVTGAPLQRRSRVVMALGHRATRSTESQRCDDVKVALLADNFNRVPTGANGRGSAPVSNTSPGRAECTTVRSWPLFAVCWWRGRNSRSVRREATAPRETTKDPPRVGDFAPASSGPTEPAGVRAAAGGPTARGRRPRR
jgi:hypothetical protein